MKATEKEKARHFSSSSRMASITLMRSSLSLYKKDGSNAGKEASPFAMKAFANAFLNSSYVVASLLIPSILAASRRVKQIVSAIWCHEFVLPRPCFRATNLGSFENKKIRFSIGLDFLMEHLAGIEPV